MRRLGKKHWDSLPADLPLWRDDYFKELQAAEIDEKAHVVLEDLDDLCILFLFSVFEAIVRNRVIVDVESQLPSIQHPALRYAIAAMRDDVEHGSFYKVLEPYKGDDADLIENVNQVRRYRNWVAHGRRGDQPDYVDPKAAFDRLQLFLDRLSVVDATGLA
jgi:hypothetical protein